MTAQELQKRNEKARKLRVIGVDSETFYVESSEGKICYRVANDNGQLICSCGDYARGVKNEPNFRCKHILSVESCLTNGEVESGSVVERSRPRLDDRFITRIEGRDFVTYPGLLDLGHQRGIQMIEVEHIQLPAKENGDFAVCRATVTSPVGESFSDIGDASPINCSSKVAKHLLRMASTRAIARALRSYTNIGMTCLEELGDYTDVIGGGKTQSSPRSQEKTRERPRQTPSPASSPKETARPASEPSNGGSTTASAKNNNEKASPRKGNGKAPQVNAVEGQEAAGKTPPDVQTQSQGQEPQTPKPQRSNGGNGGTQQDPPKMSEAQKRAIYNLSRRKGISVDELEGEVQKIYEVPVESLSSKDASDVIRMLQQAA